MYNGYMNFLAVEELAKQTQVDISGSGANISGVRESGSENDSTTASVNDESSNSNGNKRVKGYQSSLS